MVGRTTPSPGDGAGPQADALPDLAEHGRFVRNLAWRLLHDEDAAEDVVQETMLAAIKAKPTTDRSLRPWLATVARNVIRRRFRTSKRVKRREEAAAKPEATASTADMAARAEMLKDVVDAVLSLEEPNRSTILLRYYEDLPPREIAVRQGVGVETVRGRIKRAVVQLRRRLDKRHGGARGWAPLVAALSGHDVPAHLIGGATGTATGTATGATASTASATLGGIQGLAAAFLVGAGVAGAAVWWGAEAAAPGRAAGARTPGIADAPALPAEPTSPGVRAPAGVTLEGHAEAAGRLRRALDENARLRARHAELSAQLDTVRPAPIDPQAFRFAVAETAPAFDRADWRDLARHVLALTEVMGDYRDVVTKSGPQVPSHLKKRISEHNTPLALFGFELGEELGTASPNETYAHPAVIANLVRAALQLAGDPLTRAQEIAIQALGDRFEAEWDRTLSALASDASAMRQLVEEVDARLRFLAGVKDVLTGAQHDRLYRPDTEGRIQLDVLTPALLYALRHGVHASTRAELERGLLTNLFGLAGFAREDLTPFAWVAERWVDSVPDALDPHQPWDVEIAFMHIDDAQRQARAQVEATERILAMRVLSEEDADRLRRVETLLVPRMRVPVPAAPPEDGDR